MLFDDLKAFVAVVNHNSLTRAADVLSLTQSAVSRRIQHLEELLDANLFDRNNKPPKANALAHRIYQHAVPLLRNVEQLLNLPREGAAPSGTLRLGFTQIVADELLFDAVMRMKTAFPVLEVQLHTDWSSGLQHQIFSGALDAATLIWRSPSTLPDGLFGRFITRLEVLIVQSKTKPVIKNKTSIKALSMNEWILNPLGCGYRAALELSMDVTGEKLRVSVDTHDTDAQLRIVAAGLGLGLVPRYVLQKSQWCDELEVVEVTDFALKVDLWLVHSLQLGNLKQAIELLFDSVTECFIKYGDSSEVKLLEAPL